MCTHPENKQIIEDAHLICSNCGLCMGVHLDTTVVPYGTWFMPTKIYSRRDRFRRLIAAFKGHANVPIWVIEKLHTCDDLMLLKKRMKKNKKIRRFLPRICSVWRLLGHTPPTVTPEDQKRALFFYDEIRHQICLDNVSFIVLVPYCLRFLEREDMIKFCKPPSKMLLAKYQEVCEIMESYILKSNNKDDGIQSPKREKRHSEPNSPIRSGPGHDTEE